MFISKCVRDKDSAMISIRRRRLSPNNTDDGWWMGCRKWRCLRVSRRCTRRLQPDLWEEYWRDRKIEPSHFYLRELSTVQVDSTLKIMFYCHNCDLSFSSSLALQSTASLFCFCLFVFLLGKVIHISIKTKQRVGWKSIIHLTSLFSFSASTISVKPSWFLFSSLSSLSLNLHFIVCSCHLYLFV